MCNASITFGTLIPGLRYQMLTVCSAWDHNRDCSTGSRRKDTTYKCPTMGFGWLPQAGRVVDLTPCRQVEGVRLLLNMRLLDWGPKITSLTVAEALGRDEWTIETRSAAIALTIEAKSTRRTCSKPPLLCEPTSCNVIIHTPAYGMTKPLFTYHKCSTRPAVLLGITRGPVVFRRHGFLFSIFCLEVLPGTHHRPQAFSAFTTYE